MKISDQLEGNNELLNSIRMALKAYYQKQDKLLLPFRDQLVPNTTPFYIKDSYRNLILRHPYESSTAEKYNYFESSLAREQGGMVVDQMLQSLGGQREIKRILVSGSAGTGKSTLCHHLAYQWSQGAIFKTYDEKGNASDLYDGVFWLSLKELSHSSKSPSSLESWVFESCFDDEDRYRYQLTVRQIKSFIYNNKDRCLLILDGFDEVSSLLNQQGDPRQKLLQKVLEHPQIIVTTRPYARPILLSRLKFDYQIENLGFSVESMQKFVENYFVHEEQPEQALQLWELVCAQPVLRHIASIPLQTYLLCVIWRSDFSQKHRMTKYRLTGLYQLFIQEIWVRRLSEDVREKLSNFNDLEKYFPDFLYVLSKVAYNCFRRGNASEKLLFSQKQLKKWIGSKQISIKNLVETGFLLQDSGNQYSFVHLTFQEFFVAYYLLMQLMSGMKEQRDEVLRFILQNKYDARYEVVMVFFIGLVHQNPIKKIKEKCNDTFEIRWDPNEIGAEKIYKIWKAMQKMVWDAIFVFDVDWVGVRHVQLMIHALEESGRLDQPKIIAKQDKIMLDRIIEWVLSSLESPDAEFSAKLRWQLASVLKMSPTICKNVFEGLYNFCATEGSSGPQTLWLRLSKGIKAKGAFLVKGEELQRRLSADYWLPLMNHMDEATPVFLIQLLTNSQADATTDLLTNLDWSLLKNIPFRKKLVESLTSALEGNLQGSHRREAIKKLLPIWLSLLKSGDDQGRVLELLNNKPKKWHTWIRCLCEVLNSDAPKSRKEFLTNLILHLPQIKYKHNLLFKIAGALSDWNEPHDKIIEFWWIVLKQKDPGLHQRAVQRLDVLLDRTRENSSEYEKLQQVLLQHRELPKSFVLYRTERFTALLNVIKQATLEMSEKAIAIVAKVDPKQWDQLESAKIITVLCEKYNTDQSSDNKIKYQILNAFRLLVNIDASKILPLLQQAINHDDVYIREFAVAALGPLAIQDVEKSPFQILKATIDKDCNKLKAIAIYQLGDVAEHQVQIVLPIIEQAFYSNIDGSIFYDSDLASALITILKRLAFRDPNNGSASCLRLLNHVNSKVQKYAFEILGALVRENYMSCSAMLTKNFVDALLQAFCCGDYCIYNQALELISLIPLSTGTVFIEPLGRIISQKNNALSQKLVAIQALAFLAGKNIPEALTKLLEASNNHDVDIKGCALKCLQNIPSTSKNVIDSDDLAVWDPHLNVKMRVIRVQLLEKLAKDNPQKYFPILVNHSLKDPERDVRENAIRVLKHLIYVDPESVLKILCEIVKREDENFYVWEHAVEALNNSVSHYPEIVLPTILDVIRRTKKYVLIKSPETKEQMISFMAYYLRKDTIMTLVDLHSNYSSTLLPLCEELMLDKDQKIRCCAIEVLGSLVRLGCIGAVPKILAAIEDTHKVRSTVFKIMHILDRKYIIEALPSLFDAIDNQNKELSNSALKALLPLVQDGNDTVLAKLLEVLSKIGDKADKEGFSIAVIESLTQVPQRYAYDVQTILFSLLSETSKKIRNAAQVALIKLNQKYSHESILRLLKQIRETDNKSLSNKLCK